MELGKALGRWDLDEVVKRHFLDKEFPNAKVGDYIVIGEMLFILAKDGVWERLYESVKDTPKSYSESGGKIKDYFIPDEVNDLDDLSEYLNLKPDEFNVIKGIFKISTTRLKEDRRDSSIEDAKKVSHYAKRIERRVSKNVYKN